MQSSDNHQLPSSLQLVIVGVIGNFYLLDLWQAGEVLHGTSVLSRICATYVPPCETGLMLRDAPCKKNGGIASGQRFRAVTDGYRTLVSSK